MVWLASSEIDSASESKPNSMRSKLTGHRMTILLFLSLVFIFGIAMPWLGLKSGSEPVVDAPHSNNVEHLIFESDKLQLEAWWMPAENPRATLLFVHGAGSSRVSPFFNTLGFYDSLQKAGVSVLPSINETTATRSTPMATSAWARPNTVTCLLHESG